MINYANIKLQEFYGISEPQGLPKSFVPLFRKSSFRTVGFYKHDDKVILGVYSKGSKIISSVLAPNELSLHELIRLCFVTRKRANVHALYTKCLEEEFDLFNHDFYGRAHIAEYMRENNFKFSGYLFYLLNHGSNYIEDKFGVKLSPELSKTLAILSFIARKKL